MRNKIIKILLLFFFGLPLAFAFLPLTLTGLISFFLWQKTNLEPWVKYGLIGILLLFGVSGTGVMYQNTFSSQTSTNLETNSPTIQPISPKASTQLTFPFSTLMPSPKRGGTLAKVKRVIDGDTIELEEDRKVRYIGIDAPETFEPNQSVACFGLEAAKKNKELVEGKLVELVKDVSETDKYGRLLRYVFVGDIFVNDYLVREGFAFAITYPPDVAYQEQLRAAEREARENSRGLWSSCPITPTVTSKSLTQPTSSSLQSTLNSVPPMDAWNCPSSHPIKGNKNSMIYHLPQGAYYSKTKPEECFATIQDAQMAGYRASKK